MLVIIRSRYIDGVKELGFAGHLPVENGGNAEMPRATRHVYPMTTQPDLERRKERAA